MGCDCCKIDTPKAYERCQKMRETKRYYSTPCGYEWGSKGAKTTPKKKKRKKVKHGR